MKKILIWIAGCAAIVGAAASVNRSMVAAQPAPHTVEVTASRFAFSPAEITLKKNEPVVIVLKSDDVSHGLRFAEFDQNVKVKKGESAEMRFTPDKTGDFVGHCSVFCGSGHGTMALTLHVVD